MTVHQLEFKTTDSCNNANEFNLSQQPQTQTQQNTSDNHHGTSNESARDLTLLNIKTNATVYVE